MTADAGEWRWWWSVERGGASPLRQALAAPQHHAQIDTRPLASPILPDSPRCERSLWLPPAEGFDAGDSCNRASSIDCDHRSPHRRSFREASCCARKLRPENFARKLQPIAWPMLPSTCILSGEFLLFFRSWRSLLHCLSMNLAESQLWLRKMNWGTICCDANRRGRGVTDDSFSSNFKRQISTQDHLPEPDINL